MRPLDDPLTATLALGMISYNLASVADDDATTQNHDLDRLADETPRDRVAVGIEVDRAVRAHLAGQVAQLAERCASAERTQGIALSNRTSAGTPPNRRKVPSIPSNQSVCRSRSEGRISIRRE